MKEDLAQYHTPFLRKHIDWVLYAKRFFAKLIDFVVMLFPMIFVVIPIVSFDERFWPLVLLGILFVPLYLSYADGFHGAGVGKRVMGLRVIDNESGKLIGYKHSACRYGIIVRASFILDPLFIYITKDTRSIRDYAGATRVVRASDVSELHTT